MLAQFHSRILAMSFFPRLSYLTLYGGELHRKGGVLLKARLREWERELQYLRYRIAEWKQFGTVEHPDYYPFRAFLLEKVRNHIVFELKVRSTFLRDDQGPFDEGMTRAIHPQTLSSILMGCEVAVGSDDVPPLQNYADRIFAFRERISTGEITRRIHLEDWLRYTYDKEGAEADTPSQMDDMFARIRNEIGAMERRSADFKRAVDDLVRMVEEMQRIERWSTGAKDRTPRASAQSRVIRSPSDLTPILILANTRTRLPPPRPSPLRPPTSGSPSASVSASVSANRSPHTHTHTHTATTATSSRTPPSPRPARHARIHRRLFHRVFFAARTSNPTRQRTPSPRRSPSSSPPGTPMMPAGPSSSFAFESPQASQIGVTRARLPPPLEEPPIPYRAPGQGQRIFSFLQRP